MMDPRCHNQQEGDAIDCSVRTLYRQFKGGVFDEATLPMKGKRKPNGHQERRGKQAFKRHISERESESAVITLVERLTKVIIALKPEGRKACNIEAALNQWFQQVPRQLFKSITFDCGKEFSNWKSLCNRHDVSI